MLLSENIKCGHCNYAMNIIIFSEKNRTITYECTSCKAKKVLKFEEAETETDGDLFALNKTGRLTYKCSACRCYCDYILCEDVESNKELLLPAYDGYCSECYNKYILGKETCVQCGDLYDEDEDALDSFCSKKCYIEYCEDNDEEVDEEILESISRD